MWPSDLARPDDRDAITQCGPQILLTGDLQRAVRLFDKLLGIPNGRTQRSILVVTRHGPGTLVDRMTGNEDIPPETITKGVESLTNLPRHIPAYVDYGIPRAAVAERRVVPSRPIPDQPRH